MARKMGDGISPWGWVSSRQETRLKSDWPGETMLENQERTPKTMKVRDIAKKDDKKKCGRHKTDLGNKKSHVTTN